MSLPGYIISCNYFTVNEKKVLILSWFFCVASRLSSQTVSAHNLENSAFPLISAYFFVILPRLPRIVDNVCDVRNQLERGTYLTFLALSSPPPSPHHAAYRSVLPFQRGVAKQNHTAYLPVSRAASKKLCESPDLTELLCPWANKTVI